MEPVRVVLDRTNVLKVKILVQSIMSNNLVGHKVWEISFLLLLQVEGMKWMSTEMPFGEMKGQEGKLPVTKKRKSIRKKNIK